MMQNKITPKLVILTCIVINSSTVTDADKLFVAYKHGQIDF